MVGSLIARLLIAAVDEDGKVDPKSNENGAKADRHHIELTKDEEATGERDEAAKQKGKTHPKERDPAAKSDVEHAADEQHRAKHGDHDVVPHAERNFGHLSRSSCD